jgi:hypothetical protein
VFTCLMWVANVTSIRKMSRWKWAVEEIGNNNPSEVLAARLMPGKPAIALMMASVVPREARADERLGVFLAPIFTRRFIDLFSGPIGSTSGALSTTLSVGSRGLHRNTRQLKLGLEPAHDLV